MSLTARAADLSQATVIPPARMSVPEQKAVSLLVDAVAERTRLRWTVGESAPTGAASVVIRRGSGKAEGYRIQSQGNRVEITGNDERGILFGVGGLLRALEMRRDSVLLPHDLNVETSPKYALRGHQLGYRPKTNA